MAPVEYPVTDDIDRGTVLRLVRRVGERDARMLIVLARADSSSTRHPRTEFLNRLDDMVAEVLKDKPGEIASPLSGEEIMSRFGLQPSAQVGDIKAHLVSLIIDGTLGRYDKEAALVAAARFLETKRGEASFPTREDRA